MSNYFELSEHENRKQMQRVAVWMGWIFLGLLIVVTGVHAVSLVIEHVRIGSGLMWAIRVGSPVLTELFAAVTVIGFAVHAWRSGQKLIGLVIEVVWVFFAALNLMVSFTVETGAVLPGWLCLTPKESPQRLKLEN
jgi:hypothetical protein